MGTDAATTGVIRTETFESPDDSGLGEGWLGVTGSFRTTSGQARGYAVLNLSVLEGVSAADVAVEATVTIPAGGHAALAARYRGPGDGGMYLGGLAEAGGRWYALIYRNFAGRWELLAGRAAPGGAGRLRFEAVGDSLKLYLDGELLAWANDAALTAGTVGLRGSAGALFDDFAVAEAAATAATLPFADSLTEPATPGPWADRAGYLARGEDGAEGRDGLNVSVLRGVVAADVAVEADVAVPLGHHAGVVARYQGPGDRDMYVGLLINIGGGVTQMWPDIFVRTHVGYVAQIWRNLGGHWALLGSAPAPASPGRLRLEAVGDSLKLFLNGSLVVIAVDASLTHGAVGVRGTQASFTAFRAEAVEQTQVTLPFTAELGLPDGTQLGPAWQNRVGNFTNLPLNASGEALGVFPEYKRFIRAVGDEAVQALRQELVQAVWKTEQLPSALPQIARNVPPPFGALPNFASADRWFVPVHPLFGSFLYHLKPRASRDNGRWIVINHGHWDGDLVWEGGNIANAARAFLSLGYNVVLNHMPAFAGNIAPVRLSHDFARYETPTFSPMRIFLDPIIVAVNEITRHAPGLLAMTGVSGGSWMTVLAAALDTRVQYSFPVSGGATPKYGGPVNGRGLEYEAYEGPGSMLSLADPMDLYILGAAGENRKQIQILNYYDPVFPLGNFYQTYRPLLKELTHGQFDVFSDRTHFDHQLSPFAYEHVILPALGESTSVTQSDNAWGLAPLNLAVLRGVSAADVAVEATVAVTTGHHAGVVARYQGPGDRDMYVGLLVGVGNNRYAGQIWRNVGGQWHLLASGPAAGSTVRLRLEAVGDSLKLYTDGTLVAWANDATLAAGSVGLRGSAVPFASFEARPLEGPPVTLPFLDGLGGSDGAQLGTAWLDRAGNFSARDDSVTGRDLLNVAVLRGVDAADVAVEATLALPAGGHAGLSARYSGPGDRDMYVGTLVSYEGRWYAQIWRNLAGRWTILDTRAAPAGAGRLRFEAVGDSLKLYLDGELLAWANDAALTAGTVGIRGSSGALLDDFAAVALEGPPVTLPFLDGLGGSDGAQLGPAWLDRAGNFSARDDSVTGRDLLNVAVLRGVDAADVAVEATLALPAGGHAGLSARYSGPGDRDMYVGTLVALGGGRYAAHIWRNVSGRWQMLDSRPARAGSGRLRFEAVGTSLKLYLDGELLVSAEDAALTAGTAGLRGSAGALFDDFSLALLP